MPIQCPGAGALLLSGDSLPLVLCLTEIACSDISKDRHGTVISAPWLCRGYAEPVPCCSDCMYWGFLGHFHLMSCHTRTTLTRPACLTSPAKSDYCCKGARAILQQAPGSCGTAVDTTAWSTKLVASESVRTYAVRRSTSTSAASTPRSGYACQAGRPSGLRSSSANASVMGCSEAFDQRGHMSDLGNLLHSADHRPAAWQWDRH